ncbi:hypothetical protein FS749_007746 [Ceratobasidium sp. UAMH 11750]|nr:hypothetical protein FS749_007746 [Ceratobasidium sp. UAMH 11750]
MGTRGLKAYLYKNRYYRSRITDDAYPDHFSDWFAAQIPREEEARQAWIQSLGEQIEEEVAWRHEHGIGDDDELWDAELEDEGEYGIKILYLGRPLLFQGIESNKEGIVSDGPYEVEWSYVMDLDNRAFTINGLMHFRLDNMPPGSLDSYFWVTPDPEDPTENHIQAYAHPPRTPVEYIATVSRWPSPDFDIVWVREEYVKLAPLILSASDWGAPTWTSLTVSQQLSANLTRSTSAVGNS